MSDEFQISVDTSQFEAKLKELEPNVANQYMRSALQAAGDVILPAMKQHAPERTDEPTPEGNSLPPGILKFDLTTQVILNKDGAEVKVGPTAVAAHVARWQENGWMLTSHTGKKIRHIPGKHFMATAIDETREAAVNALVESLASSLNTTGVDEQT